MKNSYAEVKLSQQTITVVIKTAVALNIFFLLTTFTSYTYHFKRSVSEILHQTFNLASENVIAAWYSSMLLLSAAILSAFCFAKYLQTFRHLKRQKTMSYGWIFCILIFSLLSFDEMGSFHETIGSSHAFSLLGTVDG